MPRTIHHPWAAVQISFLVLAAIYFGRNQLSLIRFDRERIGISAFEGQVQVTGLYHYVNRSVFPASFSLGVPFPTDSEHPLPAEFHLSEVDDKGAFLKWIETRPYHSENVFRLWFWPSGERWIRLDYIQGTRVAEARYILRSTRKWGKPLQHGEYILRLGDGIELTSSNYPMAPNITGHPVSYSFSRNDFFPAEDWEFRWRVRPLQEALIKGRL
ncbi:MAG TPA: hypothetical protein VFI38_02860 [Candidatus Acidoferrum sp.]|nr:hypothetical protein [Candidatus Acidoferrum sp.]